MILLFCSFVLELNVKSIQFNGFMIEMTKWKINYSPRCGSYIIYSIYIFLYINGERHLCVCVFSFQYITTDNQTTLYDYSQKTDYFVCLYIIRTNKHELEHDLFFIHSVCIPLRWYSIIAVVFIPIENILIIWLILLLFVTDKSMNRITY